MQPAAFELDAKRCLMCESLRRRPVRIRGRSLTSGEPMAYSGRDV